MTSNSASPSCLYTSIKHISPGKKMKMLPPLDNLNDLKETTEEKEEVEVEEEEQEETISTEESNLTAINKVLDTPGITESELEGLITSEMELNYTQDDELRFTQQRASIFKNIAKRIDSKTGSMTKIFATLSDHSFENLRKRWRKIGLADEFNDVPLILKWLYICTILCLGQGVDKNKIKKEVGKSCKQFKKHEPSASRVISTIKSFARKVMKYGIRFKGDVIEDGLVAALRQDDGRATSSHHSFHNPGHNSDLPYLLDCCPSTRRRPTSDRVTADYPLNNVPSINKQGEIFVQPSNSNQYGQSSQPTEKVTFLDKSNPGIFNESNVIFDTNLRVNPEYRGQKLLSTLPPNPYVAEACVQIVTNLIEKESEDPNCNIELAYIVKLFIETITFSILNGATYSIPKMLKFLPMMDKAQEEAIGMCMTSVSILTLSDTCDDISIKWKDLMVWIEEMAFMVKEETFKMLEMRRSNNDIQTLVKQFASSLESKLFEKHGHLLVLFDKISTFSDIFLYLLFGVNITKRQGLNTIYMDPIVKSIILAWIKKGTFPTTCAQASDDTNAFCCLPLAFLTNLNGFDSEKPLSLEAYFYEAMLQETIEN